MKNPIILVVLSLTFSIASAQKKSNIHKSDELGIYIGLNTALFNHGREDSESEVRSSPNLHPGLAMGLSYRHSTSKRISHLFQLRYRNDRMQFHSEYYRRTLDNGNYVLLSSDSGTTTLNEAFVTMSYALGVTLASKSKWNFYLGPNIGSSVRYRSSRHVDRTTYGSVKFVNGKSVYMAFKEPEHETDLTVNERSQRTYVLEALVRTDVSFMVSEETILSPACEYLWDFRSLPHAIRDRIVLSVTLSHSL